MSATRTTCLGAALVALMPALAAAAPALSLEVGGNSRIGIDRLRYKTIREIFAWGKHLVFQFDTFALRVHFLLWGTFAADVNGQSVTGDYRRQGPPRLVLRCTNGVITMWSASLRLLETRRARDEYDLTTDVMAATWDASAAF